MPVRSKHNTLQKAALSAFFLLLIFVSCAREPVITDPADPINNLQVPSWFPAMPFPSDNEFTDERYELGKQLFFDPILSRDSTISCGTCHKAAFALGDDIATTPGIENRAGTRNVPSLFNVGYLPYFTREGGVPTLEMQVLVPLQEHNEMDFNIVLAAQRLAQDSAYTHQSWEAYNRAPDPFVITRALSTYERTFVSGTSPYDRYINESTSPAMSAAALRGMDLFFSDRADCSSCHSGFLFANHEFENTGLYATYPDIGRMRLTNDSADLAKFRVPSLRNVEFTAPYMHDGSIATLSKVIEHYNSGGADHPSKSPLIRPLGLTQQEQDDLLEFLLSLSEPGILTDPRFRE